MKRAFRGAEVISKKIDDKKRREVVGEKN